MCSSYLSSKYFGSKERPFPGHCQINSNAFWWGASLQHHPLCCQPVCQLPLGIQDTRQNYLLMSSKKRYISLELMYFFNPKRLFYTALTGGAVSTISSTTWIYFSFSLLPHTCLPSSYLASSYLATCRWNLLPKGGNCVTSTTAALSSLGSVGRPFSHFKSDRSEICGNI